MTEGRGRSLWPREHGAYAQLGAPLVAALLLRPPTLAAVLIVVGACLAFLAHEPLLVVLGHRGKRQRELAGRRAAIALALGAGAALAAGAVGLARAPAAALAMAGAVAIPALALLGFAWRRAERTVAGEIVAAATLSGAAAPVAIAAGVPWRTAALLWLAWSVGFAATVVAVHRVIARHRHPATTTDRVAAVALAAVTAASLAAAATHPAVSLAAPLALLSTLLVVSPPRATRLRAVGVSLLVAACASTAIVAATAARW